MVAAVRGCEAEGRVVVYRNMSLLWPILLRALSHPTRTAVIDDQRRYTYGRLVGGSLFMTDAIERATRARNVGILLPTSGAFPMALLGVWLAGRVAVPLNYLLSREELRYVIRDSDIDTIITAGPMLDHLGEDLIPDDIALLKMEEVDFSGFPTPRWPAMYSRDDVAVILYTSGTSGRPKGVMLTHGNLRSDVDAGIEHSGIRSADTFLGVLPQFHSFGLTALTLIPLRIGSTVVYTARFVPRKIVQLIEKHRPDIVMAVPSMYGALLSVKNLTPETFGSIRLPISGGEPLAQATYDAYLERYSLKILEGYGLTETSPATHWATPDRHRQHSVGQPLPGVGQYIVDDHDRVLGPNQEGEIILTGPTIMKGYYKLEDQTRGSIFDLKLPDGGTVRAFRSGDIGRIDEQGYLYITGRKKEMLIIGGENVFPREIEEVLNKHPQIKASAVIGKPDGMRGEVPIAFVELEEGVDEFDESAVRQSCRESLAQYKCPREIRVVEELPRSPTGKILRRKLHDR